MPHRQALLNCRGVTGPLVRAFGNDEIPVQEGG